MVHGCPLHVGEVDRGELVELPGEPVDLEVAQGFDAADLRPGRRYRVRLDVPEIAVVAALGVVAQPVEQVLHGLEQLQQAEQPHQPNLAGLGEVVEALRDEALGDAPRELALLRALEHAPFLVEGLEPFPEHGRPLRQPQLRGRRRWSFRAVAVAIRPAGGRVDAVGDRAALAEAPTGRARVP